MNKHVFIMIVEYARRSLETRPKVSFNELRKTNSTITATAESFFLALKEHKDPVDLKFTAKKGKVDPAVIVDLEIERR